jgi:hypothetical protein
VEDLARAKTTTCCFATPDGKDGITACKTDSSPQVLKVNWKSFRQDCREFLIFNIQQVFPDHD